MEKADLEQAYPTFKFRNVEVIKGAPLVSLVDTRYRYAVVEMTPEQYFETHCYMQGEPFRMPTDLALDAIAEYANAMKRGDVFESPPVFFNDGEWHQEGRHRVVAYYKAFGKACPVLVITLANSHQCMRISVTKH